MKKLLNETALVLVVFGSVIGAPFAAQAATISVNGSPAGVVAASTTVMFGVSESGLVNPAYSVSDSYSGQGATKGAIDISGYFTWTPSVYDGGWHTLTFSATDATNAVATTTVRILVAATSVFAQNVVPGTTIAAGRTFTFTPYAPGFTTPTFSVYDRTPGSTVTPGNMNASTGQFSWTPTQADVGTHTLILYASDSSGNSAQTSLTISVINSKVSVTSYKDVVGVGSLSLFTAAISGITNASWRVIDYPSGNVTSTSVVAGDVSPSGVFSWTPETSDIGTHAINLIATDGYGNTASTTVTIFVTATSASGLTTAAVPQTPSEPTVPIVATAQTITPSVSGVPQPEPAATAHTFNSYLGIGSKGADVIALQHVLEQEGVYSGPISGYFGTMTQAAVEAFQKSKGVSSVGYVGPQTRLLLNKVNTATSSGNTSASVAATGSSLTVSQVSAIVDLLKSFNADASTIALVQTALGQ